MKNTANSSHSELTISKGIYRGTGAWPGDGEITFTLPAAPDEEVHLILYRKGSEEVLQELDFPARATMGTIRCWKVTGADPRTMEYNYRIAGRIVTDPEAKLVAGRAPFGDSSARRPHQIRGGFVTEPFEWGDDEPLRIPYERVIAYYLHVRGFTRQKNSGVRHKGTFLGVQEKIPYLKELGVNQLILMPCYEFEEVRRPLTREHEESMPPSVSAVRPPVSSRDGGVPEVNYWGYGPGWYMAPKSSYCGTSHPDIEFKTLVRALHEAGIEIIMEFSFPDEISLTSMRDCLIYWKSEYHVDGFFLRTRQDSANMLAMEPLLRTTRMISAYFDPGTVLLHSDGTPVRNLADCNTGFRDDCRRMLKGDENQLEAFVGRMKHSDPRKGCMNYITAHDGFTLSDLVSYNDKHNEANGEENRDGEFSNNSWNCGVEGETRRKQILSLRMRQMKNAMAMLLLAQGTPIILAGDEFANSQKGNNNPWCQDNEISWVDWSRQKRYAPLTGFVRTLIRIRQSHPVLCASAVTGGSSQMSNGYPDFSCHGSRAWYGSFEYQSRHVGLMLCGQEEAGEDFLYLAFNFHWDPQTFALPYLPEGLCWKQTVTTQEETDTAEEVQAQEREFTLPGRTCAILIGAPCPKKENQKKSRRRRVSRTQVPERKAGTDENEDAETAGV